MVEEETNPSGAENVPEYTYAFLGEGIYSLNEGREFYNQINNIYTKSYPVFEPDSLPRGAETTEKFNKYFFERRVIQISEDGQRVLCFSYQDNEENRAVYWAEWNTVYEVFEGDVLIYSYKQNKGFSADKRFMSVPSLRGCLFVSEDNGIIFNQFDNKTETKLPIDMMSKIIFNSNEYISMPPVKNQTDLNSYELYSLFDGSLITTFECDNKYSLLQLLENRIALVTEPANTVDDEWDESDAFFMNAYLINIDGTENICLGTVIFDPVLSPDGNYLAYRGPVWYDIDMEPYYSQVPTGYYIKNLATNETIFYPTDSEEYRIIGWAKKEGINNLVDLFGN